MLEIVQTTITQNKPSSLPAFPSPSLLHQPSFSVRGEEREHEVIVIFIRNLERLFFNVLVNSLKHIFSYIFSTVNSFILSNKLLHRDLDLHVLVVQGSVQHDDGE